MVGKKPKQSKLNQDETDRNNRKKGCFTKKKTKRNEMDLTANEFFGFSKLFLNVNLKMVQFGGQILYNNNKKRF